MFLPLQSYLRTSIPKIGQIETDDIYIGLKKNGKRYVIPIQAKGPGNRLSPVQIEQDIAMCNHTFPHLICKPIGLQSVKNGLLELFEYGNTAGGIRIVERVAFRLVAEFDS